MDLSIITVSYNTVEWLRRCLASIHSNPPDGFYEIWVVDNASSDGSPEMVSKEFPSAMLLRNTANLGFARANNQALERCSSRYVLLLNSDAMVTEGALDSMMKFMDSHPEAGMINPKIVNPDMTLQPSPTRLQTFWRDAVWGTILFHTPMHHFLHSLVRKYVMRSQEPGVDYSKVNEIKWARGTCLMARNEVLKQVGFLDPNFFFGYEEQDYSLRVSQVGWRMFYVPDAVVVHHGSASHSAVGRGLNAKIIEAMFYYWEKHHAIEHGLILRAIIVAANTLALTVGLILVPISKDRKGEAKKFRHLWNEIRSAVTFIRKNEFDPQPSSVSYTSDRD